MVRKIWRFIKRLFGVLFILFVVAVIALIIFLLTFDLNRFKTMTETKLSSLLNHPVKIESMHTKLALVPTITISGFKILNNDPFDQKVPLLSIQKMDAELELAPMLNSQINIHKINVEQASLNLVSKQNQNNWTIASSNGKVASSSAKSSQTKTKLDLQKNLQLNLIAINALDITYTDQENHKHALTLNKFEMKDFHRLSGEIVYNKQTFTFNLNTGSIFDVLNQAPNFPFDLKIQSRLANLSVNGKIGDFNALSGLQLTTSLRTKNLRNLMNFCQITNPLIPVQNASVQIQLSGDINKLDIKQANFNINSEKDLTFSSTGTLLDALKEPKLTLKVKAQLAENKLVDLWHVQPMSLSGEVVTTPSAFTIKNVIIDANRSDAQLNADFSFKTKPYDLKIKLTSDFLSLYDFIRKPTAKALSPEVTQKPVASKSESETSIPWDVLKQVNMDLDLNIKHLQTNDWLTGYVGLITKSTLQKGVLNVPFEMVALDGNLAGTLTADVSAQSISLTTRGSHLNLNGIRKLNQQIKDVIIETSLSLKTSGAHTTALVENLNGQVILQTNQGEIINKWFTELPKLLNINKNKQNVTFSKTDSRILINCAAANIQIQNGVITGQDQLALETNMLDILAGGTINLAQKTVDLSLKPSLPNGDSSDSDVLSLSEYIRITGPFDKLTPRVDTQKAAAGLIQTGLQKLIGTEEVIVPQIKQTGKMCQDVLGKNALVQQPKTAQRPAQKSQQKPTVAPSKPQFQQQLLDAFRQALTADGNTAY